jgi:hypothetical protein
VCVYEILIRRRMQTTRSSDIHMTRSSDILIALDIHDTTPASCHGKCVTKSGGGSGSWLAVVASTPKRSPSQSLPVYVCASVCVGVGVWV